MLSEAHEMVGQVINVKEELDKMTEELNKMTEKVTQQRRRDEQSSCCVSVNLPRHGSPVLWLLW